MRKQSSKKWAVAALAVVAGVVGALLIPAVGPAGAAQKVRGIEGNTIVVGGLANVASFADAAVGAQARFTRANKTNEVKPFTFKFVGLADDKNDPATALSETRRLVTQEDIFALVPDDSIATPTDYLTPQKVPWFGAGYDSTYCSEGPPVWGFGVNGCLLPPDPTRLPNQSATQLKAELAKKGITKPTIAFIAADSQSGKTGMRLTASTYAGAGWNVVYAKALVPAPPAVVGDYSPYAQALLTSNNGKQPDVITSSVAPSGSLALFNLLKSSGFTGSLLSPFYSNALLKVLTGAYVTTTYAPFESQSKNMDQMKADIQAVKPGASYSVAIAGGYLAADMFIQALKHAGKNPTPQSVQKAAAKMTYQLPGVVGPVKYPQSFKFGLPSCSSLLTDPDGTGFTILAPYSCTTKTYPILKKFSG